VAGAGGRPDLSLGVTVRRAPSPGKTPLSGLRTRTLFRFSGPVCLLYLDKLCIRSANNSYHRPLALRWPQTVCTSVLAQANRICCRCVSISARSACAVGGSALAPAITNRAPRHGAPRPAPVVHGPCQAPTRMPTQPPSGAHSQMRRLTSHLASHSTSGLRPRPPQSSIAPKVLVCSISWRRPTSSRSTSSHTLRQQPTRAPLPFPPGMACRPPPGMACRPGTARAPPPPRADRWPPELQSQQW
jgi:hypothetical protein